MCQCCICVRTVHTYAAAHHAQVRVVDLFREWDEDQSGTVSKKEFRKAMPHLGLEVPKEAIDELFDTIDPDGSGQLSFKELQKALRRTGDAGEKKTATKAAGKPKAKGAK